MNPYDDLDDFFGISNSVALHETLRIKVALETLLRSEIENILPDRSPFLILDKVVHFLDQDGTNCLISRARISEEQCAGHIPEQLMVPAIIFSWGLALTGRLLSACVTAGDKVVAEFVQAGEVKSLLGLKDLYYTKPPLRVIFLAKKVGQETRLVVCNTSAWIVGPHSFVPAVEISSIQYAIIPKRVFLRSLRGREDKDE